MKTPQTKEDEDLEEWIIESPLSDQRTPQLKIMLAQKIFKTVQLLPQRSEQRNWNLEYHRIDGLSSC